MSLGVNTLSISVGIILLILAGSCLIPQAQAHSPLIPDNNSMLTSATFIPDPTKSWAIYGELHEGREVQYYRFNINETRRIHIMLFKSTNPDDRAFIPTLALMGPGINSRGEVPEYLELPAGAGILTVEGEQPAQATYEPFSASSFYPLAELDMVASGSGTYYIAVFEPNKGGSYGLAVGDREAYSLSEWILIPLRLISVYRWEGQSLTVVLLPIIATLAIGIVIMILRRNRWAARTLFEWTGFLAGLMFVGTGVMLLFQMILSFTRTSLVPEIAITVILALLPVLLGIAVIRIVIKSRGKVSIRSRIYLATLGISGFFIWAGVIVGPVLAILTSLLPARAKIKSLYNFSMPARSLSLIYPLYFLYSQPPVHQQ